MKVFVATPTLTGDICHEYVLALLAGILDLKQHGIEAVVEFRPGCSLIGLARNELVGMFLKTDCTDLLFIDADLCWQVDAMRRVLTAAPDVVAGAYPYKQDKEEYPCCLASAPNERVMPVDGLVRATGAPTGFMRIRRGVFEKMIAAYPERVFDNGFGPLYDLFSCELVDGMLRGEDYRFCQLWHAIGGEVWIDPNIKFLHIGRRAFAGHYHRFLLRQRGGSEDPSRTE